MKEAKTTWTEVLAGVRVIAAEIDAPFFVDEVAGQVGIDPKEAARWISKFVDWGYARRGEFEAASSGRRPRRIYHVTKYGIERELDTGVSDVDRLLEAIVALREARGEAQEKKALAGLFKAHDLVVAAREKRFGRE